MKKLLLIALLIGAGYIFATPHITVVNLKTALNNGDTVAVNNTVDFDAVRANAKNKLQKQVDEVASTKEPLESFVQKAMTATIEASINTMVTPDNLAMLVKAYHESKQASTANTASESKDKQPAKVVNKDDPVKLEQHYKDFNHFEARFTRNDVTPNVSLIITMTRTGLTEWKITDFRTE